METQNPRAVVGDNQAAHYAENVANQLARDYENLAADVDKELSAARALPKEIDDDEAAGAVGAVIKRLRDLRGRIEAFHRAEKEPHLRGGQAVDAFFFAIWDKVARRDRKNNPGAADVLQARIDDYTRRKLLAEQERRRIESEEAERLAHAAREKADADLRVAEETRLAADRARKPETIEAKGAGAVAAAAQASASAVEAGVADARAEEAHILTLARPADIVRTRTPEAMLTAAQEPYANVVDADLLDKEKLWPFIALDAKEKALRAWARTTGHTQQMTGAEVGKRAKGVVR